VRRQVLYLRLATLKGGDPVSDSQGRTDGQHSGSTSNGIRSDAS
jgi:hypothetical protein